MHISHKFSKRTRNRFNSRLRVPIIYPCNYFASIIIISLLLAINLVIASADKGAC